MISMHFEFIDKLKGIAIFLVVVGHEIAWNISDFSQVLQDSPRVEMFWWHFIYAFHMPLFFWISGFLMPREKFCLAQLPSFLWKKTSTLMFPFFFAGGLLYFVRGGDWGYWFLKVLFEFFVINVVYEIIKSRFNLNWKWDIVYYLFILAMLRLAVHFFNNTVWNEVFDFNLLNGANYLCFCLGTLFRRYKTLQGLLDRNSCYTIFFSLFILLFVLYVNDVHLGRLLDLIYIMMPVSGTLSTIFLVKNSSFPWRPIEKFLSYLGKHSLEIYVLHIYFTIRVTFVGDYTLGLIRYGDFRDIIWGITCQLLFAMVCAIVMILLTVLVMKIVRTSDVLSILFLGRKNHTNIC